MTAREKQKATSPSNALGDPSQKSFSGVAGIQRMQILVLFGLLALLAIVGYMNTRPAAEAIVNTPIDDFAALEAESSTPLRLDLLDRLKQFSYDGSHRNIFSASLPAASPTMQKSPEFPTLSPSAAPLPSPPEPPLLTVPAQFFGYVTDDQTGVRRAFFHADEDVYLIGVGDLLLGRFRLVQIANSSAELEEVATGQSAILPMEDEPMQSDKDQASIPQVATAAFAPSNSDFTKVGQGQVSFSQTTTGRSSLGDLAIRLSKKSSTSR